MKNPLKNDSVFNRFQATKDRSPRFRGIVILLLLLISCFLFYSLYRNNGSKETQSEMATKAPLNLKK